MLNDFIEKVNREDNNKKKKNIYNFAKPIEPKANANKKYSIECKQCTPLITLTHPTIKKNMNKLNLF